MLRPCALEKSSLRIGRVKKSWYNRSYMILYRYGTLVSAISIFIALWKMILPEALAEGNIIFESAIKIDIARNQSAIFVLLYACCSFSNLIGQ